MSAARIRMASAGRKASGRTSRRLAESSRLRSSHWVAALSGPFQESVKSLRAKRAHALGTNRVALVGHGRGADLLGLERLGEHAETLEQAYVGAELVERFADSGEGRQDLGILLAWIRLAGDGPARRETELLSDQAVQPPDFVVIAVEEGEVAGLGAGRSLRAAASEARETRSRSSRGRTQEILQPEAGPLAEGRQLCRLKVRVGQRRNGSRRQRELEQAANRRYQTGLDDRQRLARQQHVGVVGQKGARGAEMQDAAGAGLGSIGQLREVAQVRDYVVAGLGARARPLGRSRFRRQPRAAPRVGVR